MKHVQIMLRNAIRRHHRTGNESVNAYSSKKKKSGRKQSRLANEFVDVITLGSVS